MRLHDGGQLFRRHRRIGQLGQVLLASCSRSARTPKVSIAKEAGSEDGVNNPDLLGGFAVLHKERLVSERLSTAADLGFRCRLLQIAVLS